MIPYCKAHGIGLIPYAPLASGALARPLGEETLRSQTAKGTAFEPKLTDADKTIINRVQELAQKKGCTMSQIALAVRPALRVPKPQLTSAPVGPAESRLPDRWDVVCGTC